MSTTRQEDMAFIDAEAEITAAYNERGAIEDHDTPEADALWDRIWELDNFIAKTPPTSLTQVAVKLRRMLDEGMGLPTGLRDNDLPCLGQILDYLEIIAGKPTHPTRPIALEEQ